MSYHVGDQIRFSCAFPDEDGDALDPTTINLLIEPPDGVVTTVTYATGAVTRDAVGSYYYDLVLDGGGVWEWRWVGTDAVAQADQGRFYVFEENVEV